jgi:release factor glutamine methyltransferase
MRDERFDMIVANPPYVPLSDISGLQPEVRDHEPVAALTDGGNGLSVIARIVKESPQHLRSGGHLLIEIGFDQSEKVTPMFDPKIWHNPDFLPDLQGIPRIVCVRSR